VVSNVSGEGVELVFFKALIFVCLSPLKIVWLDVISVELVWSIITVF
jgi:hypothetical protein